jgi:hypothetical protein
MKRGTGWRLPVLLAAALPLCVLADQDHGGGKKDGVVCDGVPMTCTPDEALTRVSAPAVGQRA